MKPISIPTPGGPVDLFVPDRVAGGIAAHARRGETYEPALTGALCERLTPADTVYSVGERFGYYALVCRQAGAGAVHSFEAPGHNVETLRENVGGYPDIHVTIGAVNDTDHTLDAYAADHDPPTVCIVDIEGSELPALRGATAILADHRPEWYVEIHPRKIARYGGTQADVFDILGDMGYTLRWIEHRGTDGIWRDVDRVPPDGDYLLHGTP